MENIENSQYSTTGAHVPAWVTLAQTQYGSKTLYALLSTCSSFENDGHLFSDCSPSRIYLAKALGVNVKTITRWAKDLEKLGAIKMRKEVTATGKVNVYTPQMFPPAGYAGMTSFEEFYADIEDTGHDQEDCEIMQSTGELCGDCRFEVVRA